MRYEKSSITDIEKIKKILKKEDYFNIFVWEDKKETFYPTHTHPYEEIRWVVDGEIVIGNDEAEFLLGPGDRLISPPNTPHWAKVLKDVTYVCASR
ncbi:cupin domain-containing protein [Nitrosophilus kaiyonis]|uniref:cupin domain-containing protein n=1 Tax=Nitrosophilus kaiyonis TaxID=2930200 RepID=UPI0024928D8D|nr:cupin domain-containing protein [Nitrosophilus kaiyonis]